MVLTVLVAVIDNDGQDNWSLGTVVTRVDNTHWQVGDDNVYGGGE